MLDEYLGDGLYASVDGGMIKLRAPRSDGEHWIALEPETFVKLIKYAHSIGWGNLVKTPRQYIGDQND
jgi:hypothetical protein